MIRALSCAGVLVLVGTVAAAPDAAAHGFAGDRFFPATLQTDDPFTADEGTLGTVTKNPDDPTGGESYSYEFDISKRITRDSDFTIQYEWNYFQPKGQAARDGFGTLTIGQQYQLFVDGPHEAMALFGIQESLGHTGAVNNGGADDHTTISPTFDFGKGLGDLPDSLPWLRPFAITGNLSIDVPTRVNSTGTLNQEVFNAGFAIEYSLEYLQHHVQDVDIAPPFDHLIPLVEITSATPLNRGVVTGATNNFGFAATGVIAPGVIWSGQYYQIGTELIIPYGEGQGHGIGGLVQFHLYLDDIFPNTVGRPLLGS